MKNHKNKVLMLLSAMFLFSMVFALSSYAKAGESVDCNLTMPTMQVGTEGNVTYNTSSGTDYDIPTVSVAIFVRSPSTANSTDSVVINTTNSSNRNHINFTLIAGLDILEDSNDYTAYAICYLNGTASGGSPAGKNGNSTALTSRVIDRTAPTKPTSIVPTGTQSNNTLDIVSTVTGTDTTTCILEFISGIPNGASLRNTMTHSGNLCTARYTSVSDSTYQFVIKASDRTNTSTTTSQYITVGSDEPNLQGLAVLKQVEVKQQQQQKKSNNNNILFLIIGVIVVYAIMSNKKGRR